MFYKEFDTGQIFAHNGLSNNISPDKYCNMHKTLFLTFLFSLLLIESYAQNVNGCGYIIPPRSLSSKFATVYEAKDIVLRMLNNIQWQENFNLREQNGIRNAYATISGGKRFIVYDNNFLEDIDEYSRTKFASISIMAHEMGHHYYNHVVSQRGSNIPSEIEADAFSGYMMQKLGATLQQSQAAMNAIGTPRASSTHPAKNDRLVAITRGWNSALANAGAGTANSGSTSGAGNGRPAPTTSKVPTTPENDPSWIALYIQSNKDETVQLSDDGRTFQPAIIKVGQPFVFKFEIYQYGFLRLPYYNGVRTYKLLHGKDYSILFNRRTRNLTVVEITD